MCSFRFCSLPGSLSRPVSAVVKTSRMAELSRQIMRLIRSFKLGFECPLVVDSDGILRNPLSPRLTSSPPSSPFSPIRRSDSPPFFMSGRSDDGILPTLHFSTFLPPPSSLRRSGSTPRCSGSSPRRSGPLQNVSSACLMSGTRDTWGAFPSLFSSSLSHDSYILPSSTPVLASFPWSSSLLHSLSARNKARNTDPRKWQRKYIFVEGEIRGHARV